MASDFNAENVVKQSEILRATMKEFFHALKNPLTYNPLRNPYILFGIFCGLPIPVFSIGVYLYFTGATITLPSFVTAVIDHPIHMIFVVHPFIFAVIFGALGTIKAMKDRNIVLLLEEQKKQLVELHRANEKLKELDTMKANIIANVTHELKTPLISIRGYSEMIAEGKMGEVNQKQRNGLVVSIRNVDRLLKLIDDLLALARLDAGKLVLRKSRFDICELITATMATFTPQLELKKIAVQTAFSPEKLWVYADRDKVSHVIANLLSNAAKFTPEMGMIAVKAFVANDCAVVTVADSGCGISKDAQTHVFERFWQADGSIRRKHGGAGLGLAIVKELLDAHGAPVRIESKEGAGTSVEFRLPIAREIEDSPAKKKELGAMPA